MQSLKMCVIQSAPLQVLFLRFALVGLVLIRVHVLDMECIKPVDSWVIGSVKSKDGVISPRLTFKPSEALLHLTPSAFEKNYLPIPCGKCPLCLSRKRKQISLRLTHDLEVFDKSSFLTLTYADKNVPRTPSGHLTLFYPDVQAFLKRLRRYIEYHYNIKSVRFFCAGEYGSHTHRPHYHLILLGWSPPDLVLFKRTSNYSLYLSDIVSSCWTKGYILIGDTSSAVSSYCAKYVSKGSSKPFDDCADEFIRSSSQAGGLGSCWLKQYHNSILKGFTTFRTRSGIVKASLPKYYLLWLRKHYQDDYLSLRDYILSKAINTPSLSASDLVAKSETLVWQSGLNQGII